MPITYKKLILKNSSAIVLYESTICSGQFSRGIANCICNCIFYMWPHKMWHNSWLEKLNIKVQWFLNLICLYSQLWHLTGFPRSHHSCIFYQHWRINHYRRLVADLLGFFFLFFFFVLVVFLFHILPRIGCFSRSVRLCHTLSLEIMTNRLHKSCLLRVSLSLSLCAC